MSNDGLATVDNSGTSRLGETGVANLKRGTDKTIGKKKVTDEEEMVIEAIEVNEAEERHGKIWAQFAEDRKEDMKEDDGRKTEVSSQHKHYKEDG